MCQAKSRGGLGFRDLICFNQALVAKQGWRIIQNPNSLVAKVLKARYFKNVNFLKAKLGSKPSLIWRSILWGRQIINKGLRWRIGDGKSAHIYKSCWIPRPTTFKPFSPPKLPLDSTVSELIDEGNMWKESLIQQNFMEEDAQQILMIPLPRTSEPDQPLWHFDRRGEYTVKSGYQVALKLKCPDQPNSSENKQIPWNIIWASELPAKIKIFMWRAVKNLLPTAANLWKRKVLQSPWCQRCRKTEETIFHALFDCKASQKIWRLTEYGEEVNKSANKEVLSWMMEMAKRRSKTDMARIIALCWVSWLSRNLHVLNNKIEDPQILIAKAEAVMQSYKNISPPHLQSAPERNVNKNLQWSPPPPGWFKVNVDAAVKEYQNKEGLGVVIRNSEGKCMAAAMKPSTFRGSVAFAEAEASKLGIEIAENAGLLPLIIETDSQEVVDLVLSKKGTRTEIYWIVLEIQACLKRLQQSKIQYTSRNCNEMAHALAKTALDQANFVSWLENIPENFMYLFCS